MSSGFVTESEIAEARKKRQEEWEKVRTEDQPKDAPEEEYTPIDNRPLFHRLEEQKQKKDAEYEEAHKLKNMIRGLDDDEVGFLDLVERTKASAARQISLEEKKEMKEFRERVSTLQEQAEEERLAQQLSKPAAKRVGSNVSSTRSLLQGVVVKKRKLSDSESNGVHDDNSNKNGNGIPTKDDTPALNGNNTAETKQTKGQDLQKKLQALSARTQLKLEKTRFHMNPRKYFLTNRIVEQWNSLPAEVVEASSVNLFKNRLDSHLKQKS